MCWGKIFMILAFHFLAAIFVVYILSRAASRIQLVAYNKLSLHNISSIVRMGRCCLCVWQAVILQHSDHCWKN